MPFSIRIAMEPIITAAIRISMLIIAPSSSSLCAFSCPSPPPHSRGNPHADRKTPPDSAFPNRPYWHLPKEGDYLLGLKADKWKIFSLAIIGLFVLTIVFGYALHQGRRVQLGDDQKQLAVDVAEEARELPQDTLPRAHKPERIHLALTLPQRTVEVLQEIQRVVQTKLPRLDYACERLQRQKIFEEAWL